MSTLLEVKRHTLLDISDEGRQAILEDLAGKGADSDRLRRKYARVLLPDSLGYRVPGIVRREDTAPRPGTVPVGFSEPIAGRRGRLRLAAFTRAEDVLRVTDPYALLAEADISPRNTCTLALERARSHAGEVGLGLGVWGSAALELYTGLPCTHRHSDLDLLVAAAAPEDLARFLTRIQSVEGELGLRIDVEIDLPDGYGVALKELFGNSRTVIGKGLLDVVLLSRQEVLQQLAGGGSACRFAVVAEGCHG